MEKTKLLFLIILIVTLFGCAKEYLYLKERPDFPKKVALLPIANQTNDFDGPVVVRMLFHRRVSALGYSPIPIEEVDRLLRQEGISEGGQLPALSPQQLGKILGVDGLFYGELIEFKYVNIGFFTNREVRAKFKFVRAQTGETLWEKEDGVSNFKMVFSGEEAKEVFVEGLKEKAVEKILRVPLRKEAIGCVERISGTLPRR